MIIDRTKHPQYSYEGIEIPSSCIKEKRDDQNIDSSYSGCFCDILIWGRIRPERKYYVTKIICFFRKETVLSIAVILAILSMFWVRPDKAYFTYIDFRTLGLLFCLMAIVAGLKAVGVFDILAQKLLMGTSGTVGVIRLLVLLCFFLSMVITNDVALITFVPFALIIVHKLPKELGNYWLLKIVAMQTIAANLGSMLTPIGNPQNLYLYAKAGMSAAELITLMLPYSATALILLLIWIQVAAAKAPHVCCSEKIKLSWDSLTEKNLTWNTWPLT